MHNKPVSYQTASIEKNAYCKECGWPIVFCCVNDSMSSVKPYKEWDWWLYCSNKVCDKHAGEGMFQNSLDWIGKIQ